MSSSPKTVAEGRRAPAVSREDGTSRETLTTIARHAVAVVRALGSDTVFTLTGGMAMHLNRAVGEQPGLKAVYCQHEQAAVAAAEGYAAAADFRKAGFAVVTSGPGIANTVTSLLSANINSVPLIVLAGQVKRADIDTHGLRSHGIQEVPSEALVTPCVKRSRSMRTKRFVRIDRERFRAQLVEALTEAFTGRPGPVVVEIPVDVQGAPVALEDGAAEADAEAIRERARAAVDAERAIAEFSAIFARLAAAERPLVYVGNGVRIAGAEAWVRAFLERTRTPAVFSWPSFDVLPSDHPLNMGCPGGLAPKFANRVLGAADHIVFLGARLDLATTGFQRAEFGGQAERVIVDIDAAELKKFDGLPRTAVASLDLRALPACAIPDRAKDRPDKDRGWVVDAAWIAWCQGQRAEGLAEEEQRLTSDALTIRALSLRLSAWGKGRVVVPCASGYAAETFIRFFAPQEGCRSFASAGLGAMGFGLPMGLGAALASDRPVACVDADGGLMLNVQELATLKRLAAPGFVLFVMNNDGYESIRTSQQRHFGAVFGSDDESGVSIPPFDQLSAAFGLPYKRVETLAELDAFLAAYDPKAPPIMVDVMVARSEPRGPTVRTITHPDGRLSSTPLAEIDW